MNELAVVELQGSEAELLAKIKPCRLHIFDFDKYEYVFEDDPDELQANEVRASVFVSHNWCGYGRYS